MELVEMETRFIQLIDCGKFEEATTYLLKSTECEKRKRGELQNTYKVKLKAWLAKILHREIQAKNFSPVRLRIQELSSSPEVCDVVGEDFFQPELERLDLAEDEDLYKRIVSSPSVAVKKERVQAYLDSPVQKKRMQKEVEDLKQYLNTVDNEVTLTFTLISIYWAKIRPASTPSNLVLLQTRSKQSGSTLWR